MATEITYKCDCCGKPIAEFSEKIKVASDRGYQTRWAHEVCSAQCERKVLSDFLGTPYSPEDIHAAALAANPALSKQLDEANRVILTQRSEIKKLSFLLHDAQGEPITPHEIRRATKAFVTSMGELLQAAMEDKRRTKLLHGSRKLTLSETLTRALSLFTNRPEVPTDVSEEEDEDC